MLGISVFDILHKKKTLFCIKTNQNNLSKERVSIFVNEDIEEISSNDKYLHKTLIISGLEMFV